jgi:hypothetical protein
MDFCILHNAGSLLVRCIRQQYSKPLVRLLWRILSGLALPARTSLLSYTTHSTFESSLPCGTTLSLSEGLSGSQFFRDAEYAESQALQGSSPNSVSSTVYEWRSSKISYWLDNHAPVVATENKAKPPMISTMVPKRYESISMLFRSDGHRSNFTTSLTSATIVID